jgi:hypothetical protein
MFPGAINQAGRISMVPVFRHLCILALLLPPLALYAAPLRLDVCYDFGCKDKSAFNLTDQDMVRFRAMFAHLSSAAEERTSIRQAIALMEQLAGRQLPTANDVAGNYQEGMAEPGQMDCIDESTNTTTYLRFLQQQGLLRWHVVEKRAFRAPLLLDQHWSAQIRERQSGRRYVVDSWPDANGKPPLIQPLEDWLSKRPPAK